MGVRELNPLYLDIVNHFLQFTDTILGAEHTALGNCHVAQADVIRTTALPAPAGETGVGVFCQDKFQDSPSVLLNL